MYNSHNVDDMNQINKIDKHDLTERVNNTLCTPRYMIILVREMEISMMEQNYHKQIRLNLTKLEHYLINILDLSSGHIFMHSVTRDNRQSESNHDRKVNDIASNNGSNGLDRNNSSATSFRPMTHMKNQVVDIKQMLIALCIMVHSLFSFKWYIYEFCLC